MQNTNETITSLSIKSLHPFENHPFSVSEDDAMKEMEKSIKENGILTPISVMPKNSGEYEIISGHRRVKACEFAGIEKIPAIVRNITRDEANTSINHILKNIIYTGVIKNGESYSDSIEELQIIDNDLYQRAQEIMKERIQPHGSVPLNLKGQSLLVGNIYCAHCGNRLTLTTSGKNKKLADGTIKYETRARYQCHYHVRHPGECEGPSGFFVKIVDSMVDEIIQAKFAEIVASSQSEVIQIQREKEISLAKSKYEMASRNLIEKRNELEDYRKETIKVIRGESKLSYELLGSLIEESEIAVKSAQVEAEIANVELVKIQESDEELKKEYIQIMTWADAYNKCSFDTKKMIISQLIKSVKVGRDYEIEIELKVSFDEFKAFENCRKSQRAK